MFIKKKSWGKGLTIALVFVFLFQCIGLMMPESASAATTELTITKYAVDGTTILNQRTVAYQWLMDENNIPVMGDGETHYYHQGPVFIDDPDPEAQEMLRWNPEETQNWDTKDMGAVKGNNVTDLCDLVGGMAEGDSLQIKATDGMHKTFAYKNVYQYKPDREGPMVVCWYKDGKYPDNGYTDGMRLVWFAGATQKEGPTSIEGLPSGDYHVFGNWDWHEAADSEYWYYFSGQYPTTTGLSVQKISQLNIFSNESVPIAYPVMTADVTDNIVGQVIDITFTDDVEWRAAITGITVDGTDLTDTQYTVTEGNINIAADVFTVAADYVIAVQATGYEDATVTQSIVAPVEAPVAAFTADKTSGNAPLSVQFTDQSTNEPTLWAWDFNNDGTVDSTEQNPANIFNTAGTYTVKLTATNSAGSDEEIKTDYISVTAAPSMDILYEGTVNLNPEGTFSVSVGGEDYTINENTPLGALQAAAVANGFTYVLSDKRWDGDGVLLLDDVGSYVRKSPGYWYAYVNDVYKDGYQNNPAGLNVIELVDGDKVEYYYATGIADATDVNAVKAAATAAVKTVASISTMDVLYDGIVALDPEGTFSVSIGAENYTINQNTPLGALQAASVAKGFTYKASDKKWTNGVLLLDDIADYPYVKGGSQWRAYVNDVLKDGFADVNDALNKVELFEGDRVEYYYAAGVDSADLAAVKAAATAAVKTVAATGAVPTEWTLKLTGARDENVNRDYFEEGLLCRESHRASWTDEEGNVWGGVPLWLLVGMVDDNPDMGSKHFNFNDALAAQDYEIKIIAGDGWSTTLSSKNIARSDAYIIANTLNGDPLPLKTESDKGCWPLHLKGSAIGGGQQVGNIVRIELSGLPEPQVGWTLEMIGDIGDTITQEEFEDGLACTSGHHKEWTDNDGNVWSGMPLYVLLGAVDDIEQTGKHWTFNESLAADYTVKVVAGDGFSKTLVGADIAKSNDYIVANKCNGEPLTGASAPLRLVGPGVTKTDGSLGGASVGNLAKIEIPELQTSEPATGSWNLSLNGKISDVIPQDEFEGWIDCPNSGHLTEWTDGNGGIWSGMPLWLLAGWVDDRKPHGYDFIQALEGYKVVVKASDGYSYDFNSQDINKNNNYIIANKLNGKPLTDSWPLRLVGSGVAKADDTLGGTSIGSIVEIKLTSFATGGSGIIPDLRIVKYGEDGITVVDEVTINYLEMIERFDVIGDGETVYKYEAVTFNPDDIWNADENYPSEFKIENAIKGTKVRDLVGLVDGMGTGTDIKFVAKDGWITDLPYSSIYPDPSVLERQGEAVIAWYADGKYVPDYKDGMRLFFTPEDLIYGQWDMHETLDERYWHYYHDGDVMYPSCAGISPKYITEIRVYTVRPGDWTLDLDGLELGGLHQVISKTYFESALTCTFGADHKKTYTDSKGRVWGGMPLWLLAGFVDDQDSHSNNAFNNDLANAGYQVVITAEDGHCVTIDSQDIIRNNNYIVANTLDGLPISETDDNWPLRLVGPAVSGSNSIGNIVSIELISSVISDAIYTVTPVNDSVYTIGATPAGIKTMTVNAGISGFKYFTVNIEAVVEHSGDETVVFTHLRNGSQLQINSTVADFDQVGTAQAGFNVQAGDVIKVYIVDVLSNAKDSNPVIFQ